MFTVEYANLPLHEYVNIRIIEPSIVVTQVIVEDNELLKQI